MNKLAAVAQLAVCFVLLFCISGNGQNRPAELVGIWIREYRTYTYKYEDKIENLELFKDGMAIWNGDPGKWEVLDDHRIRVNAGMGGAFASHYKISGYELTLTDITDDAKKAKVFIRKENLEELKAKQKAKREEERAAEETYRAALDAAISAYNNKDYDRAITEYTKAINLHPYDILFINRGSAYLAKDDYGNAIADYTKSIELDPNVSTFYYSRCLAYRYKGEYDKAIEDCNIAIELGIKENERGRAFAFRYHTRGYAYAGKKNYNKAIQDYTEALRLDPNMEESYLERGKAYTEKGEYKEAVDDFNRLLQISKNNENIKEAKAGIERVQKVATNINKFNTAIKNADAALKKGDLDGIISNVSEAESLFPDKVGVWGYRLRGSAYGEKKDYDKSIADLNQAIKLAPNDGTSYLIRAVMWTRKNNYDNAIADYNEAIRLDPKNGNYYDSRARAYFEKKDYDRAIADHTKAIELVPNNASFYNSRCWAYGNKGDYDKAIADCNQAIRLDPKNAYAYSSRGFVYLGKKDYDKAIADCEAALRIAPDLKEAKDDLEKAKKLKGNR